MSKSTISPPISFWVIGVLALLWNIMGVIAYLGQANMTDEAILKLSEPEQLYHQNVATWAIAAYATAVFAGVLGCMVLLLRKQWACSVFILSLIAVLVQATYNFFIQEFMPVEPVQMIWSLVIISIAVFLVWYSNHATNKGWIS